MRFFPLSTARRSRDIAVDLGTASTVLSACGGDLIVSEPSVVAVDTDSGQSLAAGSDAMALLGRDGIATIRPLKHGVIVDLAGTEEMLRHLINKIRRHGGPLPRVIASVPSGVSSVQSRAVAEACIAAGARETRLVPATIAAALGSGLPVEEPTGSVVLDIGAGTSEVAMISMGAIVATKLIPIGGHDFDQKVATHLKREHGVLIGERVAEQIKLQISSISPCGQVEIVGRDMASELLKTVRLTSQEIRGALERPVTRIIGATQEMLSRTPPELAGDVMEGGITLTGGSSHLNGLAERLRLAIGTPVRVADAPSTCIAIGLARLADKQLARSQPSVRPALSFTTSTARY